MVDECYGRRRGGVPVSYADTVLARMQQEPRRYIDPTVERGQWDYLIVWDEYQSNLRLLVFCASEGDKQPALAQGARVAKKMQADALHKHKMQVTFEVEACWPGSFEE